MNRRDRLYHQPFINRPKLTLKNNKKIILWVIVNLEVWDPELPQPRNILPPPMGVPMLPDLPKSGTLNYHNLEIFYLPPWVSRCYLTFLIGHGMNMV